MFKKMIYLINLVLLLVLTNSASAQILWDEGGPDNLWSTALNWSTDEVPTNTDPASIDAPENTHCEIIDGVTAECETLRVGNGTFTTNLDISGGSLTASGAYIGVDSPAGHGILNMSGGLFTTGGLHIGWAGIGTLNMTGGVIELSNNLIIPGRTGGIGTVHLNGGTIYASDLRLTSEDGQLDITLGTLILDGNDIDAVQKFIDDEWLTAYDGQGRINMDYNVTNEGKTTLTGSALLEPVPADGATMAPGEVELSWTKLDPLLPGDPVTVDVYFTDNLDDLLYFTDPASITLISNQDATSVTVQVQSKTRYYWAVDCYVFPGVPQYGPIFSFYVDNLAPRVDAGADIATWLEGGSRTGSLDATVVDEEATTVQWSVISEPNEEMAVIENPTAEDTNVTLSAVGEYVLELTATDSEYSGSDTVTINVYEDSCEAAKSLPNYEPIVGDLNGDCKVDEADMALLEENWLKENALTDGWHKIE